MCQPPTLVGGVVLARCWEIMRWRGDAGRLIPSAVVNNFCCPGKKAPGPILRTWYQDRREGAGWRTVPYSSTYEANAANSFNLLCPQGRDTTVCCSVRFFTLMSFHASYRSAP